MYVGTEGGSRSFLPVITSSKINNSKLSSTLFKDKNIHIYTVCKDLDLGFLKINIVSIIILMETFGS